ncbi:MAG: tetratricopeptide repeat protein, partial [Alphaproteobacteria bacterium]|nr:tetratricopeptide repeat protein [Alphaproteobacteria bacterium]
GPCKQLGPALEKVVKQAGGKVKLVKINVDENQALAGQLRIQSIPAVYAFFQGQPVDGFVGALPESRIREFVDRLAGGIGPSPIEEALDHAKAAIEQGQADEALSIYAEILEHEPENAGALAGLVRVKTDKGDLKGAREALAKAPPATASHADVAGARAALELKEQAEKAGDTGPLEARLAADPKDHEARIALAQALVAKGKRDEAVDQLIESIRLDREWNEQAARRELLKFFEAFGLMDPVTVAGRRKLSALLFR